MHPRDQMIPVARFDTAIERMMALLASVDLVPGAGSKFAEQHRDAFAAMYHSTYRDLRTSVTRKDEFQFGASLASLGDLAKKIVDAAARPDGLEVIKPHLRNMLTGSAQMNTASASTDAAANKHSELYVATLALNADFTVDLEDPDTSAGGKNPDLLLNDDTGEWSIAVKALHSAKPPSIFANLEKAASQIAAAGRPGIVFVNAKNVVDHEGLRSVSPFASVTLATSAVSRELDAIAHRLRSEIALEDWDRAFADGRASRVIALMAQITVSAHFPTGPDVRAGQGHEDPLRPPSGRRPGCTRRCRPGCARRSRASERAAAEQSLTNGHSANQVRHALKRDGERARCQRFSIFLCSMLSRQVVPRRSL